MMKFKIFISSVQSEFADERIRLASYIRRDAMLGRFFDVFAFEETPACNQSAQQVYLQEVRESDIYLCLVGRLFGSEVRLGLSATECEYDLAAELGKHRLAFVRPSVDRDPNESRFLQKIESAVVRKEFASYGELQLAVYASLVRFLAQRGYVRFAPFDLAFDSELTTADIDGEKIDEFLARMREAGKISVPADADAAWLLNKLEAVRPDGKISNAAVLLFAREPQRKFLSSEVKCLQYWGTRVERPIPSYKIFEGGLIGMIEKALAFVMDRIDRTIDAPDERGVAAARDELPRLAVREAIVNAVCHRDYESTGSVQVMLFKDRLEIINAGSLPRGWTAETLVATHDSRPRNEILAKALDWTGYVERSGHGTEFIVEQCAAHGLRQPQYLVEPEDFHVIIWRRNPGPSIPSLMPTGHKTGIRPAQDGHKTMRERVLEALSVKPLSRKEIASILGISWNAGFFKQSLDSLVADALIALTIPEKPKSRYQQYRLTENGHAILKGGVR